MVTAGVVARHPNRSCPKLPNDGLPRGSVTAEAAELLVAQVARGHPTPKASDLGMVGPVGLEPTTYGLKVRSSNH